MLHKIAKFTLLVLFCFGLVACSSIKTNYNIDKLLSSQDYGVANYNVDLQGKFENIASMQIFFPITKSSNAKIDRDLLSKSMNSEKPANMARDNAPLVIVFHGYISKKTRMYWLGELLARKGYVVAIPTISYAENPFQTPKKWIGGFDHAIASIKFEAQQATSPIHNKINFNNLNLIGHSMGGGGLMHFIDSTAGNKKLKINSAIALAPFEMISNKPGSQAKMPVFILCGVEDYVANCRMAKKFYSVLPAKLPKAYISLKKVSHADFERKIKYNNEIGAYILAWLNLFADQQIKSDLFDIDKQDDNSSTKLIENF